MPVTALRRICVGLSAAAVMAVPQTAASQAARSTGADAVVPFTIRISDAQLADLKQRLAQTRFADEIPGAEWDYGTNLAYLQQLVTYWRDRFDWRAQERKLNRFNQFKTNIAGLDIHFIHHRSKEPNAVPLLLLNGWPSSIVEYAKVIEPLTDPVAAGGQPGDAFHVVIPSMPGYGFSDKPRERGYNPERIAGLWASLMARLGYSRYAVHGSDWGVSVANYLALRDAPRIYALHVTICPAGGTPPPAAGPPPVSANLGYQEIQTTKPQTLGHALSDSPVGLASWVVDKWHSWSDHTGDLEKVYTKDELLTNISIYWLTNTGTSSARLYYESRHVNGRLLPTFGAGFLPRLPEGYVSVPTGCVAWPSQFDRIGVPATNPDPAATRAALQARYNLVHFASMPRGGHFPALEQPAAWLDDLRAFFRERRR